MTHRSTIGAAAFGLALALGSAAEAAEQVTYLLPAPMALPAFSPFVIAQHKGYYKDAGIDIAFKVGQGGADVAVQVGAGNADVGGGIGDTSIIVRPNGVPVKAVAVLGGGALTQIVVREDSGIKSPADLKGKTIAVMAYQDTTYYSLLGTLAHFGMTKADVNAQAVGPGGVVQLVVSGQAQAMAGVPEWGVAIAGAGVKTLWWPTRDFFPGMAQAIIASDSTIAKRPQAVKGVVQATLKALKEVLDDPKAATKDYIAAMPQHAERQAQMEQILATYARLVYAGQKKLGAMDPDQLAKLQDFYVREGIVRSATPIAELYSNQFVE
jgi:NitT/TauT family transport system substrate-binding protein